MKPTALGRYFPIEIGIWADAPTAARQLCAAVNKLDQRRRADAWTDRFKADRQAYLLKRDAEALVDSTPIQPSGVFKTLRDVMPQNAAVTMDAGTLCLQATDALN